MSLFELDETLAKDCIVIGQLDLSLLLLMNNALVPWLILVPQQNKTEWTDLSDSDQARVSTEINAVSKVLKTLPKCEKLNIAAIGNVVKQLHIHIVARHASDFCWPQVVWGQAERKPYAKNERGEIVSLFKDQLKIKLP